MGICNGHNPRSALPAGPPGPPAQAPPGGALARVPRSGVRDLNLLLGQPWLRRSGKIRVAASAGDAACTFSDNGQEYSHT